MEFRHPSTIREELGRFIKMHHAMDEALKAPNLDPAAAGKLEDQRRVVVGIIAALQWAACNKIDILDGFSGETGHAP